MMLHFFMFTGILDFACTSTTVQLPVMFADEGIGSLRRYDPQRKASCRQRRATR